VTDVKKTLKHFSV